MSIKADARKTRVRLQRSAVANAVVVLLILAGSSVVVGQWLATSLWFTPKAIGFYLLALTWLASYLPEHLPQERLFPANQVTLTRMGLTALLAGCFGESADGIGWLAVSLASLVLALDGLDGWLARRGGWSSDFGARFDMETDALLILTMAALAWDLDKAGPWVLFSGLLRYLLIVSAEFWPWLKHPLPPSRRRKTVCVLQVLLLLLTLAPLVESPWSAGFAALGLTLLAYSFAVDILWLWRRARDPAEESSYV